VMLTAALPGAVSRDAGTIAVSWFEDTKLVVSGVPLNVTRVPEGKPDPVKVMVNWGLPAGAVFGETLISVTEGPPGGVTTPNTANPSVFEISDPFCALIPAAPGLAIKLAGTTAVIDVELNTVVASGCPFHSTTVPLLKPVPLTPSVKPAPPALVDGCDRLSRLKPLMVNGSALETWLPSWAVTDTATGCAMRLAGTAAMAVVGLVTLVERATLFQ